MTSSGFQPCILNCPICLKTYEDPRILPCQHSTCVKCLSLYIKDTERKTGGQHNYFPCPVCNRKIEMKDTTLFQKSLTIAALLDSKKLSTKIQKAYSKTKNNARTIGTQTSLDVTCVESRDHTIVNNKDGDIAKQLEKTGKTLTREKLATTETETGNNIAIYQADDAIFGILSYILVLVILEKCLNGSILERIALFVLIHVFDIYLVIEAIHMPYLVSLIVIVDLTYNALERKKILEYAYNYSNLKLSRWWWSFLYTNIDLIQSLIKCHIMLIILSVSFSIFHTFFEAIFVKQSVFTLHRLVNNFILRWYSIAINLRYYDDTLGHVLSAILNGSFYVWR